MMNIWKLCTGTVLTLMLCVGCRQKQQVLRLYTWSDFLDPEVVSAFERSAHCRVQIDMFTTNEEMYEKIAAGAKYDLMMPSSYQISSMAKAGMIRPIDKSLLPSFTKNFAPEFKPILLDPEMKWSIPYMISCSGVAYRKDAVGTAPVNSWHLFETAAFKGRLSLLDDMRETLGAALKCLGYSINATNSAEIAAAADLVIRWRQQDVHMVGHLQYLTELASSELVASHAYSSDAIQLIEDSDQIAFVLPQEGFSAASDEIVVAAETPCPELAHAFIDFLYDEENARRNMEFVLAAMPVTPALEALDPALKAKIVIPPETMKRGEVIHGFEDRPDIEALYEEAWARVTAAGAK